MPRSRGKSRGFTLTELAIVLGIMGTILSAIWVAASHVYASNKAQKTGADTLQILNGYRSLYAQHGVDTTAGQYTDITCMGVNAGFFPSDMIQSGTPCVTGSYTTTYPSSPWGTAAQGQYVMVEAHPNWSGLRITYYGLTQAACNIVANAIGNSSDIIYENINGTSQGPASQPLGNSLYNTSQINTACTAGTTDYVQIMYTAR